MFWAVLTAPFFSKRAPSFNAKTRQNFWTVCRKLSLIDPVRMQSLWSCIIELVWSQTISISHLLIILFNQYFFFIFHYNCHTRMICACNWNYDIRKRFALIELVILLSKSAVSCTKKIKQKSHSTGSVIIFLKNWNVNAVLFNSWMETSIVLVDTTGPLYCEWLGFSSTESKNIFLYYSVLSVLVL